MRPLIPWPKPLVLSSLLQEKLALAVENEQRERAMESAVAIMAGRFVQGAYFFIVTIDENQGFGIVRDDVVSLFVGLHENSRDTTECQG